MGDCISTNIPIIHVIPYDKRQSGHFLIRRGRDHSSSP
jgi:hypothetical protein